MSSTEHHLAISALGPDRPGLVADVTRYLHARGGNIEDSRMAILGGEFGLLILVSGSAAQLASIAGELDELQKVTGLVAHARATKSPEEHRKATVLPCLVTAEALDREGIVRAVAAALHAVGVNIVSLETSSYNAPVSGSPLFRLQARVDVPRGVTIAQVRGALEEVARTEAIDVEVKSLISEA
jgi:glycine cleavage system transcriptional repressor